MPEMKITIVGDIMCEPLMLKAAQRGSGYDFSAAFSRVGDMFAASDFVIGNLETTLSGEDARYTHGLFSFNAPDALVDAVKQAGIDLVITSNNHCLDRGVDGLVRTMETLESKGMPYVGTFLDPDRRREAYYFTVRGVKVAVVAYTYGTNYAANHLLLSDGQRGMVNLLRPQQESYFVKDSGPKPSMGMKLFNKALRAFRPETRYAIKKRLRMEYNRAHRDDALNEQTARPYLESMVRDIRAARASADLVLFCPHIGGQFNDEPGLFSRHVFRKAIEAGSDAIVASHPHVVQGADLQSGIPCFWSIGNFSMSPNSVYLLHEHLPEYGLAAHLYVDGGKLCRCAFSILKMVERAGEMLQVWPVDALYPTLEAAQREKLMNEVRQIYGTVTGRALQGDEPLPEYEL